MAAFANGTPVQNQMRCLQSLPEVREHPDFQNAPAVLMALTCSAALAASLSGAIRCLGVAYLQKRVIDIIQLRDRMRPANRPCFCFFVQ